jgi:DNA-directed RNA polymerase
MTDLYTRQAEIEYESVLLGQKRYEENRQRQGESDSAPGRIQTQRSITALTTAITSFIEDAGKGAGRRHAAQPYLLHVLPEQAAYLTIRHCLDAAAQNQKFTTAALRIGTAIEDHVNLLGLKEEAPGLFRKVMEQVKSATAEHHRLAVERHVTRKYSKVKLTWSDRDKAVVGAKLIELFDATCGIVTKQINTEGRHHTIARLVFTEEAAQWLTEAHSKASVWHPVHMPMVHPPRDWHVENGAIVGGYLTKALHRSRMMQTRVPSAELVEKRDQMGVVFTAVNAIQRTAWRVNKALLKVMDEVHSAGPGLKHLLVDQPKPLPARPAGLPDEATPLSVDQKEELALWKRKAAEVYAYNSQVESKAGAMLQKLVTARKFADEQAIYFPHYLDFRGRIYPYASYLNPQSDDVGRSLLEFAEGKPLGSRGLFWLKVHTANLFGVDKVSFADRVRWVDENIDKLLDSAARPLDGLMFWTKADSPWCALSAVCELAGALLCGPDYVSHLPIAMDGSCSGLQHYSAMLRDPIGGAAVNLTPGSKPGDIYTEVAKKAQAMSDGSTCGTMASCWRGRVVRKIAKQPTMTMCYSATVFGMQAQIAKAVHGLGEEYLDDADVRQASAYMAKIVWDAIGEVVVAAKDAMAFLKECVKLTNEARLPIRWTAPSGFLAEQNYTVDKDVYVEVMYKGLRTTLTIANDSATRDTKRQIAGIAPNFVHSLDSAHLMSTVALGINEGLTNWACIHDSFGTHACDVDVLHACIREAFIEQYTPNVLEKFREEVAAQLPPELAAKLPELPSTGALDLEAVRDSAYFFA